LNRLQMFIYSQFPLLKQTKTQNGNVN